MMSITPTAIIHSASSRPHANATSLLVSAYSGGLLQNTSFDGSWVCSDHMSTEHNPTANTTGSKRLGPGSFVGDLT